MCLKRLVEIKKINIFIFLLFCFLLLPAGVKADTVISSCPYAINYPGRYYLDGDIFAPYDASWCIRISASNVLLDLMGHKAGRYVSWTVSAAVEMLSGVENVTVINGTLIAYGGSLDNNMGVTMWGNNNVTIENVAINSGTFGLYLEGSAHVYAKNIFMNLSLGGYFHNGTCLHVVDTNESVFEDITCNTTVAIYSAYSFYNIYRRSNFHSGTVDFYKSNCNAVCESVFGLVTENECYNNTFTSGPCPEKLCEYTFPTTTTIPRTTTTISPVVTGCRPCDYSKLDIREPSQYVMTGMCLLTNLLVCNTRLFALAFVLILAVAFFLALGRKQ